MLPSKGGCGGGILTLYANKLLKVDGRVSANGGDGSSASGGGSGGSIYMKTAELDGSGTVEVNVWFRAKICVWTVIVHDEAGLLTDWYREVV